MYKLFNLFLYLKYKFGDMLQGEKPLESLPEFARKILAAKPTRLPELLHERTE